MIDQSLLTRDLKRLLVTVEDDIRARCEETPEVDAHLRIRYESARTANRTAQTYPTWRDGEITQAGVAWLLGCVFVRFLEDNRLIDDCWMVAPGQPDNPKERIEHARDHYLATHRAGLHIDDRAYLELVFTDVARLPGVAELFDRRRNPLWQLGPSGQGARKILDFFQKIDPDTNTLIHDFTDSAESTRFLGDLYQNISESARKRYALLQTPDFVVNFILDRTLTPALDEFGLPGLRLIDPACGSGHFLLAAFDRLFAQWSRREPATEVTVLAQRALDSVYGVDVNPYAVAIARFRLLIAALTACRIHTLLNAPDFHFNLTAGDSLLHGPRPGSTIGIQVPLAIMDDALAGVFETEDKDKLRESLGQRYAVVVGNPPYINVKDAALGAAYRARFKSCHDKYQLGVPFTERCFDLALSGAYAGYVGMITSNAFMKRIFGKKLIEVCLPRLDMTHMIDTSGVCIPGHGTPTVIIFGRNRPPIAETVRAVRGIRGETQEPEDPARAPVWLAILNQVDSPSSESRWVSSADVDRSSLGKHPWPIGGGGAAELGERIEESCEHKMSSLTDSVGPASFPGLDDLFCFDAATLARHRIPAEMVKRFLVGKNIRHWGIVDALFALTPYAADYKLLDYTLDQPWCRRLWPHRTTAAQVISFNKKTRAQLGEPWWSWYRWIPKRLQSNPSIVFPSQETHNQFVLARGGNVFNRHAPLIRLTSDSGDNEYVALLGVLNSSSSAFLLRQKCFPKGGDPMGKSGCRVRRVLWDVCLEFDSTKIGQLPLPRDRPARLARAIQSAADEREEILPSRLARTSVPNRETLDAARQRAASLRRRLIALQEELDWDIYHLYDLADESLTLPLDQVPEIELGERAFEIVLACGLRDGDLETTWFQRHGSTPITTLPVHWPETYRALVQRRIDHIGRDHDIALIEQPEYKRRWNLPTWEEQEKAALESWLLDRLEMPSLWPADEPALRTVAQLAHEVSHDAEFAQVATLFLQSEVVDYIELVRRLVTKESVPFLPILRYKQSGLNKRKQWEETWALQRREDAGEKVETLPPPKYSKEDFLPGRYWDLRGELDVTKERWILYPHLERNTDRTPVVAWAGYDFAQQARALAGYYQLVRSEEGWERDRLIPILAGLQELMPWLQQWHAGEIAEVIGEMLRGEMSEFGLTDADLREWRPTAAAVKAAAKKRTKKQS